MEASGLNMTGCEESLAPPASLWRGAEGLAERAGAIGLDHLGELGGQRDAGAARLCQAVMLA